MLCVSPDLKGSLTARWGCNGWRWEDRSKDSSISFPALVSGGLGMCEARIGGLLALSFSQRTVTPSHDPYQSVDSINFLSWLLPTQLFPGELHSPNFQATIQNSKWPVRRELCKQSSSWESKWGASDSDLGHQALPRCVAAKAAYGVHEQEVGQEGTNNCHPHMGAVSGVINTWAGCSAHSQATVLEQISAFPGTSCQCQLLFPSFKKKKIRNELLATFSQARMGDKGFSSYIWKHGLPPPST